MATQSEEKRASRELNVDINNFARSYTLSGIRLFLLHAPHNCVLVSVFSTYANMGNKNNKNNYKNGPHDGRQRQNIHQQFKSIAPFEQQQKREEQRRGDSIQTDDSSTI